MRAACIQIILSDNIHDALCNPGCCNWAAGVQKQFASLGVPSPFSGGRTRNVDHHAFRKAMLARDMSVWGGLQFCHVVLPLRVPSFAPICGGLRGRTGLARSPITSCPFQ